MGYRRGNITESIYTGVLKIAEFHFLIAMSIVESETKIYRNIRIIDMSPVSIQGNGAP